MSEEKRTLDFGLQGSIDVEPVGRFTHVHVSDPCGDSALLTLTDEQCDELIAALQRARSLQWAARMRAEEKKT